MVFFHHPGCFLDGFGFIVLTMVILLPTIEKAGIDPIWFGIYVVLVVEMAQITPPVGFNLFVLQGMTKKEITWLAKHSMRQCSFLMVGAVLLIYFFPASSPGCRRHGLSIVSHYTHSCYAARRQRLTVEFGGTDPSTQLHARLAGLNVALHAARDAGGSPGWYQDVTQPTFRLG